MAADKVEVGRYLTEIKAYISSDRYTISPRPKNEQLETDFILKEQKKKHILLSLEASDFSHTLQNEHKGYEHETLYVFGKSVELLERFGCGTRRIPLYIKFNMIRDSAVIVVSFHQQAYELPYPFK